MSFGWSTVNPGICLKSSFSSKLKILRAKTENHLLFGSPEGLERNRFARFGLELHGRRSLYSLSSYERDFLSGHESILSSLREIAPHAIHALFACTGAFLRGEGGPVQPLDCNPFVRTVEFPRCV